MKPNILISGSDMSRANYENALSAAGADWGSFYLPALGISEKTDEYTACTSTFVDEYDGLLLAGGGDVDSTLYGQEPTLSGTPDPARDQIELKLIRLFMEAKKPILGICRGFQIMNVALGGTLHQDVGADGHVIHTPERPAVKKSTDTPASSTFEPSKTTTAMPTDKVHLTRTAPFSFLGELYGPTFATNSAHHQSVDRLADPLLAIQWAMEDGCIEGAIHPAYPYLGVQWHPERMCLAKAREDTVDGLAVFQYFISTFF